MKQSSKPSEDDCAPGYFERGDRMSQSEFHRAYDLMPADHRAELIAGMVHEPSPLSFQHGKMHVRLSSLFDLYSTRTPEVETADNATVILGEEDELQPDLFLRIAPSAGGQSTNIRIKSGKTRQWADYVSGPPELVAEIALTSRAIDFHLKKQRYHQAGVLEYLVLCLQTPSLHWFDLQKDTQITEATDDIIRSRCFPGLWIHAMALFELNYDRSMDVLHQGLDSTEHLQFAQRLTERSQSIGG